MNKSNIKIVFMGTPEFSAKILQGLLDDGYDIIGVITEPDKPTGRKMEILPTPVKRFSLERGLKVFQPEKKINVTEAVQELQPDLCVVAAYGKIIPRETLDIPKYGCINFHASLLPELRGPSPIQSAILQGLGKTGVTIMIMDEGMDTGPILSQVEITLDGKETSTTLRQKMLECGLPLLLNTIPGHIEGEIEPRNQVGDPTLLKLRGAGATYCKMIEKEDGHLVFANNAEVEFRRFRAFDVWPGAYAFWENKRIKFVEVEVKFQITNDKLQMTDYKQGQVFLDENKNLCVRFAEGYWIINKLQLEGKKETSAKDFLNGNRKIVGAVLK